MKTNATAVANFFVEKAKAEGVDITLLGLIKRVYITHGFTLAFFDKPAIDVRFDKVEAWRYGPVIPSVYHSFKHNKSNPITELSEIVKYDSNGNIREICTPKLEDEGIRNIADMVWKRYYGQSDSSLVSLTHRVGTPWSISYVEGENRIIDDILTKSYYLKVIENGRK